MYKAKEMIRRDWDKEKDSSYQKLVALKDKFLTMHKNAVETDIDVIQQFLYFNYEDITSSQLRNVFSLVLNSDPSGLTIQRIKLAYIAGRTDKKKKGMHSLLNFLDELFQKVQGDPENYKGVKTFTEAIVAYHKYYESLGLKPSK